jgi:hypothetical protein
MSRFSPLFFLAACQGLGQLDVPVQPLVLTVNSPLYGSFAGDSPSVIVAGEVSDANAVVWIEGRQANVGGDGHFSVELDVPGAYRIIDVEAANPLAHLRERVPVFSGHDPMETWPGVVPLRVTPLGLDALGDTLEPTVDALGWEDSLFGALPTLDTGDLVFIPVGLTHEPTDVRLVPAESGLDMDIAFQDVVFEAEFELPLLGADTLEIGFEEIVFGIEVQPEVDASGMLWLAFGESTIELTDPILQTGTFDPVILEDLLTGALGGLGGAIEAGLDLLLGGIGALPLGGPIAFEMDLLGTPIALSIEDLYSDWDGLALVLGLDFGEAGADVALEAPTADDGHFASHAVLALHEGLFQALLASELLDLLTQDLELGGMLGAILDLPVRALPGGEAIPPEAAGWCLSLNPGEARVVRMTDDQESLAVLYMPDLQFDIGYSTIDSATCVSWLEASLALEVGVGLDADAQLVLDIDVAEGAVLYYATTAPWNEQDVVGGLSGLLELATGLLGGGLGDLGGLFGGGETATGTSGGGADLLGLGSMEILDVRAVVDSEGHTVEGLKAMSLRLFE